MLWKILSVERYISVYFAVASCKYVSGYELLHSILSPHQISFIHCFIHLHYLSLCLFFPIGHIDNGYMWAPPHLHQFHKLL